VSYRFLRYVRLGIAASIAQREADPAVTPRASFDVLTDMTVNGNALPSVQVTLSAYGPSDVIGLDETQIVRRVPEPGTMTAPTDGFAFIEFARSDLPWLFSPYAPAAATDSVRPWMCLAVVKRQPGIELNKGTPLPLLKISAPATLAELLPLTDVHAWAHVQIDDATATEDVAQIVVKDSDRLRSRLISPRLLEGGCQYIACVLPTFEGGRLSGLGREIGPNVRPLDPAWQDTTLLPLEVPVYAFWEFGTGPSGGFEELVRKLTPRATLGSVGVRDMDASRPGGGIPPTAAGGGRTIVELDAALRIVGTPASVAPPDLAAAIEARLELPNEVSPPRYGRWHAAADRSIGPGAPPWLGELNRDPVRRVAAGLGAQVVQQQQEELMAVCWDQAGAIMRANQLLRSADLALAASERIYEGRLMPLGRDFAILAVSGPAIGRVRVEPHRTVRGTVRTSCLPILATSGAFRKIARPGGSIGRRVRRLTDSPLSIGLLLERLSAGQYQDPPPTQPDGAVVVPQAAIDGLRPGAAGPRGLRDPRVLRAILATVETIRRRSSDTPCTALDVSAVRNALAIGFDPRTTIPARVNAQIDLPPDAWRDRSGVGRVMIAPKITTPMYAPLLNVSHDWFLAGLGKIPVDTLAIVEPNLAFIEAYFVGLNHEMSRELLWRGFPTDQRGTIFDRFWDEDTADIAELHTWESKLGNHGSDRPPAMTVVLMRGDLVRRFPAATIFLQKARAKNGAGREPEPTIGPPNSEFPLFGGIIAPDIRFVGFGIPSALAKGTGGSLGYYVAFQEVPGHLRFGPPFGTASGGHQTAAGTSDVTAKTFVRKPFRLFIHADDMLP
jgi:hypothetical protein